ncbi:hypothetical protein Tco_1525220 [Tanacetum coccineum]
MSSVTDIKYVLTQKGLDTFCQTFYIPDDVHPQLPSPNQIIHEMPTGKIGVYTRFFEYANFRLPLSTFLINVLRYYHINLSQLSVIAAAKVSHFEILCRVYGIEPTMDHLAFIHVTDPTKVKVRERESAKEEARLLDSTGDSAAGGGQEIKTRIVRIVAKENVAAEKPKRPRKKRQALTDADVSSHPPKKLKSDYGTSSGAVNAGKSPSALRELLASSILNVESGVEVVATLPFVTSSVFATPEHESGVPADSITGLNLRTIGVSKRFVISSDSSHHSNTNVFGAEGDSIIRSTVVPPVMTEAAVTTHVASIPSALAPEPSTKVVTSVHASMFHDSDSTGMVRPDAAGSSHVPRKDLLIGSWEEAEATRLRTQVSAFEAAKKVHVDELNILKQKNVALKDERNSLNGKVAELQSLVSVKDCELKDVNVTVTSLKSKNDGLADQVHALETTCFGLHERLFGYENLTEWLEEFQNAELKVINERVEKLDADLAEMACHLEEKFYPHLLTTIFDRRWLLTYVLKLILVKFLNSSEYLTALGAAISRSIEKEMQDGLAAGIDHGREGRSLADISHKDASIEDIMNLLRLEGPFTDAPGMGGVWTPLSEPLSIQNLIGAASTSTSIPVATGTTTALSTTFASASSIPPITVEDYEIIHADGQENSQGNVQGNAATVEFEKEDLDTTPEHDLLN